MGLPERPLRYFLKKKRIWNKMELGNHPLETPYVILETSPYLDLPLQHTELSGK